MHLCIGTMYTWGNLTTYITSYMRENHPDLKYSDTFFVYNSVAVAQAATMPFAGIFQIKYGFRKSCLIGSTLVSLGTFLTRYTVAKGLIPLIFTYGLMFGIGMAMIYTAPIASALTYLPEKRGRINGVVVMGFGLGAFVFSFIMTAYLNPHDCKPQCAADDGTYPTYSCPGYIPPTINVTEDSYFSGKCKGSDKFFPPDSHVAKNVPDLMTLLSIVYAAILFSCSLLMVPQGLPLMPFGNNAEAVENNVNEDRPTPEEEEDDGEVPTLRVIRTRLGWQMWFGFLLTGMGGAFLIGQYKTYGQQFSWSTDAAESHIASAMSVGNAAGRLFHGSLADRFGFAPVLIVMAACCSAFLSTIALSHHNEYMFAAWCCTIAFLYGGNFALYPTGTVQFFGRKHFPSNFGFMMSGFGTGAVILGITNKSLVDMIGFPGMSIVTGVACFIGMVNTIIIYKMMKPEEYELIDDGERSHISEQWGA